MLRRAIVGALLEHGSYTPAAADNAARALAGFALGLVGFSVYLFVLRAFYAHQDTRTPFVINVVQNVLNIALAIALVGRYDILGLAAALAISYVVCSLWALQVLTYKVPGFPLRAVFASLWRILVAAAVAGEVTWLVASRVGGSAGTGAWLRMIVGAVVGVGAYVGVLAVLKAPELNALRARLPGTPFGDRGRKLHHHVQAGQEVVEVPHGEAHGLVQRARRSEGAARAGASPRPRASTAGSRSRPPTSSPTRSRASCG